MKKLNTLLSSSQIKNNEEIIQNKIHEVEEKLTHQDFFNAYILDTLDSFAYRYLDEPNKAELLAPNVMRVTALENGIKEAVKIKNAELRAGISVLAKKVSKAESLTIMRELRVDVTQRDNRHAGICNTSARISFGHPKHEFGAGTFVEKLSAFKFDDDLHLRNELLKHLEAVCELFSL